MITATYTAFGIGIFLGFCIGIILMAVVIMGRVSEDESAIYEQEFLRKAWLQNFDEEDENGKV